MTVEGMAQTQYTQNLVCAHSGMQGMEKRAAKKVEGKNIMVIMAMDRMAELSRRAASPSSVLRRASSVLRRASSWVIKLEIWTGQGLFLGKYLREKGDLPRWTGSRRGSGGI